DVCGAERRADAPAKPRMIGTRAREHHLLGEVTPSGSAGPHHVDDVLAGHLQLLVETHDIVHRAIFGHDNAEVARREPAVLAPRRAKPWRSYSKETDASLNPPLFGWSLGPG